jgi:hypothetical protein
MIRGHGRTALLLVSSAVAFVGSARADGTPSRVALVRTSSTDRLLREAGIRLRAELVDAGFDVVDVDRPPGDPRAEVEDAASDGASFATVAINRAGPGALADVWISDHVTGKTVVRRLEVEGTPNAADVLAIRALELLRASLLEVAVKEPSSSSPRAAPTDVLEWIEPVLPEREVPAKDYFQGTALGVGVLALHGLRGIGVAAGPTLRVSHGLTGRWFGRASLAGPLVGPVVVAPDGSASVRQEFASLDFGWASSPRPLGVVAWIGAGAFDFHVTGSAIPPFHSRSDSVLSFLVTAGVGGVARLGPRVGLTAELAALALDPEPAVTIGNRDAGMVGAPSIALSLGIVVGL